MSYYGIYDEEDDVKPVRSFSQDAVKESQNLYRSELKEMEDRLKRHVTECKLEIIKNIMSIMRQNGFVVKPKGEEESCLKIKRNRSLPR